jgi:adenylate cyclase
MPEPRKHRALFWGKVIGALLVAGIGALCLAFFPIGDALARLSYDAAFLPRLFRPYFTDEIVMVYLDQRVEADMAVPTDKPLDRRFQAQLVRRLKADGAKLILFDFLFLSPSDNPQTDQEFAESIKEHGAVVLATDYDARMQTGLFAESILQPTELLRDAAAGCGLAKLTPDPDGVIRKLDTGSGGQPSASWRAAELLGAEVARRPPSGLANAWLNYYGPPSQLISVNMDRALAGSGVRSGFFSNSIVVVGARPSVNRVGGDPPEEFATPFSRFGRPFASGAQIFAISVLNLLHKDWIKRLNLPLEYLLVILCGLGLGATLGLARPWPAFGLAILSALIITAAAVYFQLKQYIWFAWLIPVAVQTPLALVWSVGYQYVVESRRRNRLHRAFDGYLSPHIANRLAEGDFDLSLGGKVVEATVMFSDLAGFTAMSESLNPQEVSNILISYFNQTTRGIREHDGTTIRYMGDAVMAVWGAPLPNEQHADHAVRAAWAMIQAGRTQIAGHTLRTRIGINSGKVLAGNLGSVFRFDYTAIGDTTNLASRLESLNKQLGTDIIISQATRDQISGQISTRALGRVAVAGKSKAVAIYEVLGLDQPTVPPEWLAVFDEALRQFQGRNLDRAKELFSQVIKLRARGDGPSEFYLQQIAAASQRHFDSWDGTVTLEAK